MQLTLSILLFLCIGINLIIYGGTRLDCKLPGDTRKKGAIGTLVAGCLIAVIAGTIVFATQKQISAEATAVYNGLPTLNYGKPSAPPTPVNIPKV